MATLRLRLLGQPLVWRDEQPVRFKTRKALAAVAYVAAEGGLPSREQLAALLWPDHDLVDARKNLRTALSYVHQALGDGALTATHEAVSLDPAAPLTLDLDLQTLARVLRQARTAEGDDVSVLQTQLEQAVALYRGPFLAGLDIPDAPEFEAWLAGQRAYWLGVAGELLERLAGLQAAAGDLGHTLAQLRVDGGLSRSRLLMQTQADLLQAPVEVYPSPNATALGVAALARFGIGAARSATEAVGNWRPAATYEPACTAEEAERRIARWLQAADAVAHGVGAAETAL